MDTCKIIRISFVVIFLISMAVLPAGPVFCAEPADLLQELDQIKNKNEDFKIKLWTKQDKQEYKAGETVEFMFTADKDCYVYIIDVGTTSGAAPVVLFPNEWHKSNAIEKGKTYTIPPEGSTFVFRVKEPAGVEHVKAIASLEPMLSDFGSQVQQQLEAKGGFARILKAKSVVKDIGIELATKNNKLWAETQIMFRIVPASGQ